jgi:hypothetical protein
MKKPGFVVYAPWLYVVVSTQQTIQINFSGLVYGGVVFGYTAL